VKISTEIASTAKHIGEEKAVELIAKAGFTAWDFSMFSMIRYDWASGSAYLPPHPLNGDDYIGFARRLKQIGLDNGIVCNQSHAPFPTQCKEIESYLKRAIECTAEAGGEICVIHPYSYGTPEENAEMYLRLLPFAKDHGVKIATENMWGWDKEKDQCTPIACATPADFNAHLDAVNDDSFVACLDIGHAEMRGSTTNAVEMIEALGSRLQALHIHDNDQWHDSHQIPFSMDISFVPVIKALKRINYSGYLTLEADQYLTAFNADNIFEGITHMADSAKVLHRIFTE